MVKRNDLSIQLPAYHMMSEDEVIEFDPLSLRHEVNFRPHTPVQPPHLPRMPCFAPVCSEKKRPFAYGTEQHADNDRGPKHAFHGKQGSEEWQRDVGAEFKRSLQNHPDARYHTLYLDTSKIMFLMPYFSHGISK